MYWPTASPKAPSTGSPVYDEIKRIRPSRQGNFFAAITRDTLSVWDVRAAVLRPTQSIDRWGENVDVIWAHDGRGIIILTSTSHLLIYQLVPTSQPAYSHPPSQSFPAGGGPGEGDQLMGWELKPLGSAFVMGGCESFYPQQHHLVLTLRHPPSVLLVPYPLPVQLVSPPGSHFPPPPLDGGGEEQVECEVWDLGEGKGWMRLGNNGQPPIPKSFAMHRTPGIPTLHTLITSDGRVYAMYASSQLSHHHFASPLPGPSNSKYTGQQLYPIPKSSPVERISNGVEALGFMPDEPPPPPPDEAEAEAEAEAGLDKAVRVGINPRFGLVAVGTESGMIHIISTPSYPQKPRTSHSLDLKHSANLRVQCLTWSSDGYCLAVGYERGWATWSMGGRLSGWGMRHEEGNRDSQGEGETAKEGFMNGVTDMFWSPGNMELFILARLSSSSTSNHDQLYTMAFAKSATASQPSPDNTRYAFLQMDDRVLVYRGADQPDMSVINPESDVWQHIKIPNMYISTNWPIRYASISPDGVLVAVAGRRGLTHYSAASGRWKLFEDERQERDFTVRGGLLWFHHVLVAAVEVDRTFQIRLYSRDLDLTNSNILHSVQIPSPVQVMSLLDNSLLVYTADNTLFHFLIIPTKDNIKLHLCGSISFDGIVEVPSRVRTLSWLIPKAQKVLTSDLGDPVDDLVIATIIFLVDGKLVLLRPRRAANDEVRYDMQILADRIETYWTHLHGIGTLENSLWGYDGQAMRIWLDALTIEATRVDIRNDAYETVEESVSLKLDFYPLSILMDKGIIIGTDHETSGLNLPFTLFKIQTLTHLFIPRFLRYHLAIRDLDSALLLASNYAHLVYFAHALEILLHSVLEDEVDAGVGAQPVSTSGTGSGSGSGSGAGSGSRQMEAAGKGNTAPSRAEGNNFDSSTAATSIPTEGLDDLQPNTAADSPLPVLPAVIEFLDHFPQSLEVVVACARKTEIDRWDTLFHLVGEPRELFERCIRAGKLRTAGSYLLVLHNLEEGDYTEDTVRLLKLAMASGEFQLCKELLHFLHSIDESGESLRRAIVDLGIAKRITKANTPASDITLPALPPPPQALSEPSSQPLSASSSHQSHSHSHSATLSSSPNPSSSSASTPALSHSAALALAASNARRTAASPHLRVDGADRAASPFQLASPRQWVTPPSPKTVVVTRDSHGQAREEVVMGVMPDQLAVPDEVAVAVPDVEAGPGDSDGASAG